MKTLRAMFVRFAGLFRRRKLEAETNEELRGHIEALTERNVAAGMSSDEAYYAALRTFGGVEQLKERSRDERRLIWFEQLLQDLRYAARQLRKHPGFAAVIIVTLAVGIGANSAVFSILDFVLFKSLPVKNPAELVILRWESPPGKVPTPNYSGGRTVNEPTGNKPITGGSGFSVRAFEQFRAHNDSFSDLFAFGSFGRDYAVVDGQAENSGWEIVSGGFHQGLGVQAIVGRILLPADDLPEAPSVAVLSYSYWQRRFGGDPSVIGKTVFLQNAPTLIVGVTSREYVGLQIGTHSLADYTIPLVMLSRLQSPMAASFAGDPVGVSWLNLMGRPKTGISAEQAVASLQGVFAEAVREARPEFASEAVSQFRLAVESARQGFTQAQRDAGRSLWILAGLVGLVLLLACLNVANLLLARGTAREKEIAVRLAVGASRLRLIRQLLTESALLAVIGTAAGLLLALWGKDLLRTMQPLGPGYRMPEVPLDLRVVAFTAVAGVLTIVGFGLVPALRATRSDIRSGFSGGLPNLGSGARSALRLGGVLVVVQIGMSLLLLVTGTLFVRTLYELRSAEVGFNRRNVLVFGVRPKPPGYKVPQLAARIDESAESIRALPRVRMVTYCLNATLSGAFTTLDWFSNDFGAAVTSRTPISYNGVAPGFFEAYEMPILAGRGFTERDEERSAKVAVVNQAMARKYFGAENPIGRRLGWSAETASEIQIVGVVRDAKTIDVRSEAIPTLYIPYRQQTIAGVHVAVRTEGDPRVIIPEIKRVFKALDASLMITNVRTTEQDLEQFMSRERLFATLASFFGVLAVPMVCIGLYGLVSYTMLRRTREIGIRMALGAPPQSIRFMVLRQFLRLIFAGLLVGVVGAWAASRVIASMLFAVSPTDSLTYAAVAVGLSAVTLIACWAPAHRAAKIDPTVALRAE